MTKTIITNHKPREMSSWFDLPESERDDFDYVEESDRYNYRFFKYLDSWYDFHEFETATGDIRAAGWHAWQTDSYFSATLIKYNDDDDTVTVGRARW